MTRRARCPLVAASIGALAAALALAVPTLAAAQVRPEREVETTRGPAAELYIRKRPPAPEAPVLSAELKTLLASTEKRRDDKRLEAIGCFAAELEVVPDRVAEIITKSTPMLMRAGPWIGWPR